MLSETLLALAITVSTSTGSVSTVSASASGGSSAEASTHTSIQGGTTKVNVVTEVEGVRREERYEAKGEPLTVSVIATSSGSTTTATASTTRGEIVARVLALVRSILSYFGLSVR